MEEKNESRINIEDLPQFEQELTTEEAKDVKGGLLPAIKTKESASEARTTNNNTYTGVLTL